MFRRILHKGRAAPVHFDAQLSQLQAKHASSGMCHTGRLTHQLLMTAAMQLETNTVKRSVLSEQLNGETCASAS